jgi:glyoxylase-like metal-dependent hydrolase (beta-lactamase superfamily II)
MKVRSIPGGDIWANSYIAGDILIDAGVPPMAIEPYRDTIRTIVLSHCHYDHIANIKSISHMCKVRIAIHRKDAAGLVEDEKSLAFHFGARSPGILPDLVLEDGDFIGDFQIIHTPGHTPGSICLYSEQDGVLISGDTVFSDGAFGRYDFPGGSRLALMQSLERLASLTIEGLYPGHGDPVGRGGSRHITAALGLIRSGYG